MNINYTRRTSGYISAILALATIKVFFEALLLGRGPVPGLSFLFYTLIFYVHYALDEIEQLCFFGYGVLIERMNSLRSTNYDGLISESYGEYLAALYSKIADQVKESSNSLSRIKLNIIELSQSRIHGIRTSKFQGETSSFLDVKSIWVDANSHIQDYVDIVVNFSRTVFTWIRAISNVLVRKVSSFINGLGWNEVDMPDVVVTKKVVDSSDDTT